MSTWNIFTLRSDQETWDSDGTIPRPNSNLETAEISTQQKIKLADGSNAFVTPETKYTKEPFTMFFADTTSAFRSQLSDYKTSGDKLKIVTHTGEEFIGRIIEIRRIWFVGVSPDEYDVSVIFEWQE